MATSVRVRPMCGSAGGTASARSSSPLAVKTSRSGIVSRSATTVMATYPAQDRRRRRRSAGDERENRDRQVGEELPAARDHHRRGVPRFGVRDGTNSRASARTRPHDRSACPLLLHREQCVRSGGDAYGSESTSTPARMPAIAAPARRSDFRLAWRDLRRVAVIEGPPASARLRNRSTFAGTPPGVPQRSKAP